jgi:hypothetical protein
MATQRLVRSLQNPKFIKGLQLALPISLSALSGKSQEPSKTLNQSSQDIGVALCLYGWVIPMIRIGGSARSKIAQFELIIELGYRYLQSSGRILAATLLTTTLLLRNHPSPAIARQWKIYALSLAILAPAAPWEEFLIFPTNDRIEAMGEELRNERRESLDPSDPRARKLNDALDSWQRWHVGRIVFPFVAALTTGYALL